MDEYRQFFGVYAAYVRNSHKTTLWQGKAHERAGTAFVPLKYIPGPAILMVFDDKDWKVQITEATSDVREQLEIPTPWMEPEELPDPIYRAAADWAAIWETLGYEHSAWNAGLAQQLLEGKFIPDYLAMGMPHFRYRPGDEERPFGVLLVATKYEDEMKLDRVYNPQGIPDVLEVGAIISFDELVDGKGPLQKMLRTWALMEGNYRGRYDHRGQRLAPKPQPRREHPSDRGPSGRQFRH